MTKGLLQLIGVAMLVTLMFMPIVFAQEPADIPVPASAPIWTTLNAPAQGNYPGGNIIFNVFVVNSAAAPADNETIENMTLTAPFQSNFGIGLPTTIMPGQAFLGTIALQIPTNFTQSSFTANLVGYARLWNGTAYLSAKLTGQAVVNVLSLPSQTTSTTATQSTTSSSGTVSTSLLEAGVAIPSIIVVLLLVLLARGRPGSKPMGM